VIGVPLQSSLPEELVSAAPGVTLPEARRLVAHVHRHGRLPGVTPAGVLRTSMAAVRARFSVPALEPVEHRASRLDPFVKHAFRAPDGSVVESVRIPLERAGRFVACVSSQVGCGLGCVFCGTGRMGLGRNLEAWEIVEQVRLVREALPDGGRLRGVVFQGMGEPLANLTAVLRALRVISEPSALAVDARNVTVCTAGLGSAFARLFEAAPNVRVGVSIGSAIPERRARLMPLERSQPLAQVLERLADHAARTRIAPMLAYTLLGGVNDGDDEIDAMAALARGFAERSGIKPRISLLAYNPFGCDDAFGPSSAERVEAFRAGLGRLGIPVVRRYSGGADVGAACGQLGIRL
jgi:23S rRNA (adenine2503-C2)-methyltransferase